MSAKPVAGQEVYVVEQTRRGEPGRQYFATIARVGTKFAYIKRYGREAPYDWKTGFSVHRESNSRINGHGFDVYESQRKWAERQRQAARLRDLKVRLVGGQAYVAMALLPECVEKIHAVLDEFGVAVQEDGRTGQ